MTTEKAEPEEETPERAPAVLTETVIDAAREVIVSALWLRRVGHGVEVLVEMDGKWWVAIEEDDRGPFSWIAEARGHARWKRADETADEPARG